ncbi:MAG: hypothetical protein IH609_17435 [Dehalococcoidia bacterium]|nr:hypothetical protein [Dehalococcoidia bacterium]
MLAPSEPRLRDVQAARYVETGEKTGKVVLRVSDSALGKQHERAATHEVESPSRGWSPISGAQ